MQNVVNYIVPFFGTDGKPISAGRVFFCNKNTSASKSSDITPPDLIIVKDKDGAPLQNPLPLNDNGQFSIQPFVDDSVDYKMYVDEPTGLPPLLGDDSPCWNTVFYIYSVDRKFTVEYEGIPCVGSIAELRGMDPENGKVIVLGYNEPGDFCPPRTFNLVKKAYAENYGTHIVPSSGASKGVWACEPGESVDIRWFGIDPASDADNTLMLDMISKNFPNIPIYFPKGDYRLSFNLSFNAMIMDRGVSFLPFADNSINLKIGHLENRGGRFFISPTGNNCVIPFVNCDVFHTSWLSGSIVNYIVRERQYTGIFDDCKSVMFDNEDIEYSTAPIVVDVGNKPIINAVDKELPGYIKSNYVLDFNKVYLKSGEFEFSSTKFTFGDWRLAGGHVYYKNKEVATTSSNGDINLHGHTTIDRLSAHFRGINVEDEFVISNLSVNPTILYDGKKGDIRIVYNDSDTQKQLIIEYPNATEHFYRYTYVNAGASIMVVCLRSVEVVDGTEVPAKWAPVSPNSTIYRSSNT